MRASTTTAVGFIMASALTSARSLPSNFKRQNDYPNEVVAMVHCKRMQDGSNTPYGTKDQMWWANDWDAFFKQPLNPEHEAAYVHAPGQGVPTILDWTTGTTQDPITGQLRGETFMLYRQDPTGDPTTNVTGTASDDGTDFTCYQFSDAQAMTEDIGQGVKNVCEVKYACSRSERIIVRTSIQYSEGTQSPAVDGLDSRHMAGGVDQNPRPDEEIREIGRKWAEKFLLQFPEAESTGGVTKQISLGKSKHSMYFNIQRSEKEGDAHWDPDRVTTIAKDLAAALVPAMTSSMKQVCRNGNWYAECDWLIPFPSQVTVRYQMATQKSGMWVNQDVYTIQVMRDADVATVISLRRDPRMLKIPPYLSLVCILVGIVWLFLLPLDDYCRRTYISENALLPGQVHTYFGGSEKNIHSAFRYEVDALVEKDDSQRNDVLEDLLKGVGLKVGRQNYTYTSGGDVYAGENIYGILQAPRGDATEALVLVAAWKSIDGLHNSNGVSLALALTRYFKRWSLWSKDIILLLPPDSTTGTQAWVDAYHDAHNPSSIAPLPLKSGALQGAIAIDYPAHTKFDSLHIIYDGTNGQLPNLDLINSIVSIADRQMSIKSFLQNMWMPQNNYHDRLMTMLRGMMWQGMGMARGPHSGFIPYHVDAVTLQPRGEGWHDEMLLGRLVEGSFRSLNNLLEHLHQSFFFYLLMNKNLFVSIGTYLPSAMLLAANFTIMAIFLWVKSGQSAGPEKDEKKMFDEKTEEKKSETAEAAVVAASDERDLVGPMALVGGCFALSAVPLSAFNYLPSATLDMAFAGFTAFTTLLPFLINALLNRPPLTFFQLTKSFSLLLLGMTLSTLATLNFSLAFIVAVCAAPLTFVQPSSHPGLKLLQAAGLMLVAPTTLSYVAAWYAGVDIGEALRMVSFGWNVWGMYTPVVVWCVWWPAWMVGMVGVVGGNA